MSFTCSFEGRFCCIYTAWHGRLYTLPYFLHLGLHDRHAGHGFGDVLFQSGFLGAYTLSRREDVANEYMADT